MDDLPGETRRAYSPDQARALILAPQPINIVAGIMGNRVEWDEEQGIESAVFAAVSGRRPDAREAEVTRAMFIACVDHSPATPSSLAAVANYSGGNALKTALATAILAMGDVHAGAGEGAARLFREFMDRFHEAGGGAGNCELDGVRLDGLPGLAAFAVDKVTGVYGGEKRRIPGYGHRYYSAHGGDPRAEALLRIADELGLAGEYCELARRVAASLQEKKAAGLCINIDGVIGALLCEMGLRPEAGKALFIMPRTIGVLAQLLEQRPGAFFRLSNDSIIYTGPEMGENRRFE